MAEKDTSIGGINGEAEAGDETSGIGIGVSEVEYDRRLGALAENGAAGEERESD